MKKFTFLKMMLLVAVMMAGSGSVFGQYSGVGTFNKITSLTELTNGYYVVVNSGDAFAMNNTHTNGTFLANTAVTSSSGVINNPAVSIVWKIEPHTDGGFTIYNEEISKYVSYTGSSNNVQVVDAVTAGNQRWNVSYASNEFTFTNATVTARMLQYNANSPRFACYTSSQQKLLLYKMEEAVGTDPVILANPTTLDFGEVFVNNVSTVQQVNVVGANLTAAPIYSSDNTVFTVSGTLTDEGGTLDITFSPTTTGAVTGTLTIGGGGQTATVALSGTGVLPPLATPVANDASNITQTGFTANWDAVSGAMGYQLDVSTKTSTGSVTATDLFFSEYGEGSGGNKKYIEVYNGTGIDVDLADYVIKKAVNGAGWNATVYNFPASTILANGTTFVLANNNTDVIGADAYDGFCTWNGDDAIGLFKNDVLIDQFGNPDADPGSGWDVAGITNATADKILIRKPTVTSPTTDWEASFGTTAENSQWIVSEFAYNDVSQTTNLGSHTLTDQLMETKTPVTGSPFTTTETSQVVTGLSNTEIYYYTVTALRGTEESPLSNEIGPISLVATGLTDTKTAALAWASHGKVMLQATAGETIEIFNVAGQKVVSRMADDGLNTVNVPVKGVVIVKAGNRVSKVIL